MAKKGRGGTAPPAPGSGDRWARDRLVMGYQLLAFLPTLPGVTVEEMAEHLDIRIPRLYALLRALRESGFSIESQFNAQGKKIYWLAKQDQGLIDKIIRR